MGENMPNSKEFLYVGYYITKENETILKIGTTNDLHRRQLEHTRNYRKTSEYTMPSDETFHYLWHLPLSKYNTLRYEDRNREAWQNAQIGKFIRNDRFLLSIIPETIDIIIRKKYTIPLKI